MRTGSRTCNLILTHFDFQNQGHQLKIHEDKRDYSIILNTRHPYSRLVSLYNMTCVWEKKPNDNFKPFVEEYLESWYPKYQCQIFLNEILNERHTNKIKFFVKLENLTDDLRKIPFINENYEDLVDIFENEIKVNRYYNDFHDTPFITIRPWQEYYNQDLINLVYNKLKYQFDFFSYNPDYWTDGKP